MIDEDWLAAALQDLGTTIEAPADGPQRILAEREGLSASDRVAVGEPKIRRRSRRVLIAVTALTVAVCAIVVSAYRSGSGSRSATMEGRSIAGPSGATTVVGGLSGQAAGLSSGASASSGGAAVGAPGQLADAAPLTSAAPVPTVATRVIKSGTVDLVVGRGTLSPTVDQLDALTAGLGGYVADTKTTEGGDAPSAEMTLRVPANQFESLLTRTRGLGKPTTVTTSGQDVTATYVDLDARIQALQATRTQFLQILAKASAIGDILAVEQQLSGVQTQIEQLQGQQRVLDDQTSFAALSVHLGEQPAHGTAVANPPRPPSGLSKAWAHARHTFSHGFEAVIAASGGLAVFVLCVAGLLLAVRLVWPVVRRRLV